MDTPGRDPEQSCRLIAGQPILSRTINYNCDELIDGMYALGQGVSLVVIPAHAVVAWEP